MRMDRATLDMAMMHSKTRRMRSWACLRPARRHGDLSVRGEFCGTFEQE